MSTQTQKIFFNLIFFSIIIVAMITVGGKAGQKIAYAFLAVVLLGMIISNKDKINPILNSFGKVGS